MRILRILFLHFQNVFESRTRAFVWFLTSIFYPLILILFWQGASAKSKFVGGWSISEITSYYFFLTFVGPLLSSHIEESVSVRDIQGGLLSMYLMKPFSYYWKKFFEEFPNKILQGGYGVLLCFGVILLFKRNIFTLAHDPFVLLIGVILVIGGMVLSFSIKSILGILAFWVVDSRGLYELFYMIEVIFSGLLMPLIFLPIFFATASYILPYSYFIYFPISVLQGKLGFNAMLYALLGQSIWILLTGLIYHKLWQRGVRKFSAIGQ